MNPHDLSVAFSIWAAVVGLVGAAITVELYRLRGDLKEMSKTLNALAVDFEHRLTKVESDILRCPANTR